MGCVNLLLIGLIKNLIPFFDSDGQKLISDMLTVWDDDASIIVCHPNHLFRG